MRIFFYLSFKNTINKQLLLLLFFALSLNSNHAFSALIRPHIELTPLSVVKHQLDALMTNDIPYVNAGIDQVWALAHPNNKRITGPINRFANMIHSTPYRFLINHKSHQIKLIRKKEDLHIFDVGIVSSTNETIFFEWHVKRAESDWECANCWLTVSVSLPREIDKSI